MLRGRSRRCTDASLAKETARRLEFFALGFQVEQPTLLRQINIKIPKLPFGPLSVRSFRISYLANEDDGDEFIEDDRIFETIDTDRFQVFAVDPPIMLFGKSPKFRIVCLSTAKPGQGAVGYFSIRFA